MKAPGNFSCAPESVIGELLRRQNDMGGNFQELPRDEEKLSTWCLLPFPGKLATLAVTLNSLVIVFSLVLGFFFSLGGKLSM